uniref:Uncharacterized protein n=1 Tax=Anguilla anguilla TaxID=7936 RepID=A0A0E9W7G5_ANGAN
MKSAWSPSGCRHMRVRTRTQTQTQTRTDSTTNKGQGKLTIQLDYLRDTHDKK